jgi:hypothetical protein
LLVRFSYSSSDFRLNKNIGGFPLFFPFIMLIYFLKTCKSHELQKQQNRHEGGDKQGRPKGDSTGDFCVGHVEIGSEGVCGVAVHGGRDGSAGGVHNAASPGQDSARVREGVAESSTVA